MNKKKILVTGNLGYVGSVLTNYLFDDYEIVGYDIGYFQDCKVQKLNTKYKFKHL